IKALPAAELLYIINWDENFNNESKKYIRLHTQLIKLLDKNDARFDVSAIFELRTEILKDYALYVLNGGISALYYLDEAAIRRQKHIKDQENYVIQLMDYSQQQAFYSCMKSMNRLFEILPHTIMRIAIHNTCNSDKQESTSNITIV
ncbi:MAG: hypothetical protein ACI4TH_06705, partial [Candidatus Ornithomonoglobus sp.]